ncbi:hypothetical protein B0H19DRAFT_1076819 [Mycena capillaripes]|nr:hypothetical protein B0H19DRAFT_1076819 [Mycena capillaripes]
MQASLSKILEARRQNSETMNWPVVSGKGGAGGKSALKGGDGGLGEGPQLAGEHAHLFGEIISKLFSLMRGGLYSQFHQGGLGGLGGEGGIEGGLDRKSQGPKVSKQLVSLNGRTTHVPKLTVAEFCQELKLSEKIYKLLTEEEFETAGALLEVSDITLAEANFESRQIVELKRALKEFLAYSTKL